MSDKREKLSILQTLTVSNLKEICEKNKLKGYSGTKKELAKFMVDNLEISTLLWDLEKDSKKVRKRICQYFKRDFIFSGKKYWVKRRFIKDVEGKIMKIETVPFL